ncbi:hypothetical protein DFQ04_3213 [Algoriphagus boseongensis]|uniref:Uncharacterized protein n=1 Tax=Algoriphagus boseongensis TaxID=1442587 RepID=A0A4R6T2H1_9BACT|nr:hypothetical protein DFQ04_3213 [Algoriphagus boseongensis]
MVIRITHIGKGFSLSSIFLPKSENLRQQELFAPSQKESQNPSLSVRRLKIKHNLRKKSTSRAYHKSKIEAKRERILELRRQKFAQFRIDYMPLFSEEDMIIYANSQKSKEENNQKD